MVICTSDRLPQYYPFAPVFWGLFMKPNIRKIGTLIIRVLLGTPEYRGLGIHQLYYTPRNPIDSIKAPILNPYSKSPARAHKKKPKCSDI